MAGPGGVHFLSGPIGVTGATSRNPIFKPPLELHRLPDPRRHLGRSTGQVIFSRRPHRISASLPQRDRLSHQFGCTKPQAYTILGTADNIDTPTSPHKADWHSAAGPCGRKRFNEHVTNSLARQQASGLTFTKFGKNIGGDLQMAWTTPTLVEICIGLEINGYLPAEF
jgi:coenzyme PQQ precursor peptide PqqA